MHLIRLCLGVLRMNNTTNNKIDNKVINIKMINKLNTWQ